MQIGVGNHEAKRVVKGCPACPRVRSSGRIKTRWRLRRRPRKRSRASCCSSDAKNLAPHSGIVRGGLARKIITLLRERQGCFPGKSTRLTSSPYRPDGGRKKKLRKKKKREKYDPSSSSSSSSPFSYLMRRGITTPPRPLLFPILSLITSLLTLSTLFPFSGSSRSHQCCVCFYSERWF